MKDATPLEGLFLDAACYSQVVTPSVHDAVERFAARVRAEFGARVREIVVFGSHARGDATPESDVDVAVVVDDLSGAEGRAIAHVAGDVLTELDVLISTFTVSTARMGELRSRERRIADEIARDGIAV